ncbi:hypothetical protein HDU96_009955 [Phlyctochytrium bullatum]|nr:hypothetical protein HDU96_009955 [Phlyctochytrium bullatum]
MASDSFSMSSIEYAEALFQRAPHILRFGRMRVYLPSPSTSLDIPDEGTGTIRHVPPLIDPLDRCTDKKSKKKAWPRMMVCVDARAVLTLRELGSRKQRLRALGRGVGERMKESMKYIQKVARSGEENEEDGEAEERGETVVQQVAQDEEDEEMDEQEQQRLYREWLYTPSEEYEELHRVTAFGVPTWDTTSSSPKPEDILDGGATPPTKSTQRPLRVWRFQIESMDVDPEGRYVTLHSASLPSWAPLHLRHRIPRKVHLWAEAIRTSLDCHRMFHLAVAGSTEWCLLLQRLVESEEAREKAERMAVDAARKRRSADERSREMRLAKAELELGLMEERSRAAEAEEKVGRVIGVVKELLTKGYFGEAVDDSHPLLLALKSIEDNESISMELPPLPTSPASRVQKQSSPQPPPATPIRMGTVTPAPSTPPFDLCRQRRANHPTSVAKQHLQVQIQHSTPIRAEENTSPVYPAVPLPSAASGASTLVWPSPALSTGKLSQGLSAVAEAIDEDAEESFKTVSSNYWDAESALHAAEELVVPTVEI